MGRLPIPATVTEWGCREGQLRMLMLQFDPEDNFWNQCILERQFSVVVKMFENSRLLALNI